MKRVLIFTTVACLSVWGQRVTDRRSADIRGGGGEGKCTIEVVVDDVAEVEISGRNAVIRTINGAPASFRRFVCNQEMPIRPVGFRFEGIDGRGRQDLIRSAEDSGRAIVRIEDSKGGSEGYTFDIFWRGGGGGGFSNGSIFGDRGGYDNGGYRRGEGNNRNGGGWNNGNGNGGGWNNGWGDGNGWISNGNFNYEGGRRGAGSYRDRNGDVRRLDNVRVLIGNAGNLVVEFETDRGRIDFAGRIDRRQGRRVFSSVRNRDMTGTMEIEMGSYNTVNRITIRDIDLNWTN